MTTPAGMSVFSAMMRPSVVAHRGRIGAGRSTVLPAASAGPSLQRLEIEREVPGGDGPDDAGRLAPQNAGLGRAHERNIAHGFFVFVVASKIGPIGHGVDVTVALHGVREQKGAPYLGDDDLAQLVFGGGETFRELRETLGAKRVIDRPSRFVESAAGRADGGQHVFLGGVGANADHLFGGRVDVLEGRAVGSAHQPAADEIARFGGQAHGPINYHLIS